MRRESIIIGKSDFMTTFLSAESASSAEEAVASGNVRKSIAVAIYNISKSSSPFFQLYLHTFRHMILRGEKMLGDFLNPYIIIGADGILVDGIKRVCKWENEKIEAVSKDKRIIISGEKLKMEYKTLDSLLVRGKVEKIEFARDKR